MIWGGGRERGGGEGRGRGEGERGGGEGRGGWYLSFSSAENLEGKDLLCFCIPGNSL